MCYSHYVFGGRPDAKNIVIVLTDGSQTRQGLKDLEDSGLVARELRDIGCTVLAIGIGSEANKKELCVQIKMERCKVM